MKDKRVKWTKTDLDLLKKSYSVYPYKILPSLIDTHGISGCYTMASRLKLAKGVRNPGLNLKNLSDVDRSYIAGIIDGEGSILINTIKKTNPVILVSNTDLTLMEWLKEKMTAGKIHLVRRRKQRENHKLCYQLNITGINNVYDVLKAICPYMIIKKEKAISAIKLLEKKYFIQ